jgi:predicted transcriptional regulator of viral defense system
MATISTSEQVRRHIRASKAPVFTTSDVLNGTPGASRELVDQVISRMVRAGELQRISRGLFSRPKAHPELGPLPPHTEDIAAAVERSIGMPVIPSGALALNMLHLSEQVPAQPEFITAGPARTISVGKRRIHLKHAPVRRFRSKTYTLQLIVEALKAVGRQNVSDQTVIAIRNAIAHNDRATLSKHIGDAPVWMQPHLRRIATE